MNESVTATLCHMLDELGVEHETYVLPNGKCGVSWIDGNNIEWEAVQRGENLEIHALQLVTPEQAIAATAEPNKTKEWRSVALGLFDSLEKADLEVAQRWLCENDLLRQEIAYGDAKAATVGAGTCRCTVETSDDYYDDYTRYHMSCGFTMYGDEIDRPRFCGGCGRRIEEE